VVFFWSSVGHSRRKILNNFLVHKTVYVSTNGGNTKPKASKIPRTKACQVLVREFVRNRRAEIKRVTGRQVLDFLVEKGVVALERDHLGAYEKKAFEAAYRTTRRWLQANDYKRGRRKGNLVLRADIAVKRDVYLQAFFTNRALPKDERLREVYLDESYIHEHYHRFDDSLWDPSDDQDVQVGKMKHKGRRYCFLAAIQGPDPRVEQPSPIRKEQAGLVPRSLWRFSPQVKKDSTGDYHKVFNSTNFIAWWRDQLLPNLTQPCLIMMDNAKYHLTCPADIPKIDKLRKADCRAFLERKGVAYGATDTVPILHKRARDYIEAFEMRECEKLAHEQGHTVLMTPPYHSDFQPIELLWARVKGEVGRQYDNQTTLSLVLQRLMDAFDRVEKTGQESVLRMIEKCALTAKEFYKKVQAETIAVDGQVSDDDHSSDEDEEQAAPAAAHPDDERQGASDGEGSYDDEQAYDEGRVVRI
jgi:transposase